MRARKSPQTCASSVHQVPPQEVKGELVGEKTELMKRGARSMNLCEYGMVAGFGVSAALGQDEGVVDVGTSRESAQTQFLSWSAVLHQVAL